MICRDFGWEEWEGLDEGFWARYRRCHGEEGGRLLQYLRWVVLWQQGLRGC